MRFLILLCLALPVFSDGANSRIIGGTDTSIADHPHQLSLRVTGSHSCGASLVSSTKAVTAAHCGGAALASYSILAGATVRTDTTCSTCVLRSLTSYIRHSGFINNGNQGYPNDVATLHFSAIEFNINISPITMASSNAGDHSGQNCVITGWGNTFSTPGLSLILQQGIMQVITNTNCASRWSAAQINSGHICLSSSTVCPSSGDTGGPLVCDSTLVGAMSWGSSTGVCSSSYPSVYTRISYFRSWIDNN